MGDAAGTNSLWLGADLPENEHELPARTLRLTPASSITPRPVRWTWHDRIPTGELTLTPGRGGIGKSTFHAWVIARITTGQLVGAHEGQPKPCIIAATEDSWERTIVPRLIVADADLDLVYRVDVVTDEGSVHITLPTDMKTLGDEINRLGAALLSVDPLLGVVHGGLDTHKDADVRRALTPLAALADRTGCAVLGNAHFNKSNGSDPLSLVMGSAAFGNVSRAALGFARDTDDDAGSCVISQVKNNLGRLDLPSLRYRIDEATIPTAEGPAAVGKLVMLGESDRSVADILRDNGSEDRDEFKEIDQWLLDYLTDGGGQAPAAEVIAAAKKAGFNESTLQKARRRLKAKSERTGFGKGSTCTWLLPIDAAIDAIDTQSPKPGTYGTYEESMADDVAPIYPDPERQEAL